MISKLLNWMSEMGDKATDFFLNPYMELPGYFKFLILIGILFLSVIGLFHVAKHALKTVVGIACVFVVLLVLWIIF